MRRLASLLSVFLLALVAAPSDAAVLAPTDAPAVVAAEVAGDVSADTFAAGALTTPTAPTMRAEFRGLEAFAGLLDDVDRRVSDTAPLMRRIAEHGRSSTVKRIRAGVDVEGRALAPLAASTIEAKGSTKPLVDRGDFLGSQSVDSGPEHAAWGSDLPQAAAITAGTDKAGRSRDVVIPERQVYGLDAEDEAEVDRLSLDHLAGR